MNYSAFEQLCKERGTTPTAVGTKIGLKKGNTTNWKKGGNPSVDILIQLSVELNCTTDYLLFGKERKIHSNMVLSEEEQELLGNFKKLPEKDKLKLIGRAELLAEQAEQHMKELSIISEPTIKCKHSYYKVSAGKGFSLGEGDSWEDEEIDIPDTPESRKADMCLTIMGDSMEPVYKDGDIVLVREQAAVDPGQIGIFIVEGKGYIKKYGGDRLISLNDNYDDIMFADYDSDSIRCVGAVIGRV